MKFQHMYGVRLEDGAEFWFTAGRVPANWKSWVMQQMPYGTVFTGCQFMQRAAEVRPPVAAGRTTLRCYPPATGTEA